MLLYYFGEKNEHNCGQCDVCLNHKKTAVQDSEFQCLKEEILTILNNHPLSTAELRQAIDADREKINEVVSFLLSEEIIHHQNGMLSI